MKIFPMGEMMKILFVDNSADLQQKWIEPLRAKGWGVVRARSMEDADRMMVFHGDALQAIVVNEKFVSFAEKNDLVFVVLTSTWKNPQIVAHQNSEHSAVGYIPYAGSPMELVKIFDEGSAQAAKATGTDGVSLENYSDVLSKPETPKKSGFGLQLDGPSVALGGNEISASVSLPEVAEMDLSPAPALEVAPVSIAAPAPVEIAPTPQMDEGPNNSTMILDATKLSVDFGSNDKDDISLDAVESFDIKEISNLDDLGLSEKSNASSSYRAEPEPSYRPQTQSIVAPPPTQFAINPNHSSQISDVDTLKSYLALREQDVAVLTGQLRSSQERIQQLESLHQMEKARSAELAHLVSKQEQTIKNYDLEKKVDLEVLEKQVEDMTGQLKERTDKFRIVEAKLRLAAEEINKVKDRVRVDIRRIRVREKELENQLEILKKDSSALIQARDEKVLELKRKIDLLEFNMELVQEQYSKERQTSDELRTRLKDAATVMKQAGGMLEQ